MKILNIAACASLSLILLLISSKASRACSFYFEIETIPSNLNEPIIPDALDRAFREADYQTEIPKPSVALKEIVRGKTTANGFNCDDAGLLHFEVALPVGYNQRISEYGMFFRVVDESTLPDAIFHHVAFRTPVSGEAMNPTFVWLDGHPSYQKPLDFEVEIYLVTDDLKIGPPAKFHVTAPVNWPKKEDQAPDR